MKYRVNMTRRVSVRREFVVEAGSETEARQLAEKRMALRVEPAPGAELSVSFDSHSITQLNGPWVYGGWYDLHGPDEIVVFTPAPGNFWRKGDVPLLRRRLERIGLKIVDSWNGNLNGTSVSFRCKGRKGTKPMTKAQMAVIQARPRRKTS